jgi:hypothetical protein
MDVKRLKQAYDHLQSLDDRLTYKIRPRSGGGLTRPSTDQLEEKIRELASYTIELKDILNEVIRAVGSRPKKPE